MQTDSVVVIHRGNNFAFPAGSAPYEGIMTVLSLALAGYATKPGFDPRYSALHHESKTGQAIFAALVAGPLTQSALKAKAGGIDDFALRTRLGGIAKVAKRLGVPYPIQTKGTSARNRVFWLSPEAVATIEQLARP